MPIQWLKSFLKARLDIQSQILAKNASWMFVANSASVFSLFIQSIILGRFLGPELFGVYVLVTAVVETVQEALNPNADSAVVKYAAEFRASERFELIVGFIKLAFLIMLAGASLSVLVIAILSYVAGEYFFQTQGLAPYALLFAAGRSLTMFDNIGMGLLRVFDRFRFNSILRIILVTLDLIVVLVVALASNARVEVVLVAMTATLVVGSCVRNLAAIIELRKYLWPYRGARLQLLKDRTREIRNFMVSNSLSKTLKTGMNRLDFVLLGTISGTPSAVGVYAIAKKLASSIAVVADPLIVSVYPQLSALVARRAQAEIKGMLRKASTGIAIVAVPLWLALVALGKPFIGLAYGDPFVPAYWPVLILSASLFSAYSVFWAVPLLLSLGRASTRFRIDLVSTVMWLGLILALVPSFGAVGSAVAYGVCVSLMHALYVTRGLKTLALNVVPAEKPVSHEPV